MIVAHACAHMRYDLLLCTNSKELVFFVARTDPVHGPYGQE